MEAEPNPLSRFAKEITSVIVENPKADNKTLGTLGRVPLTKLLESRFLPERYANASTGRVKKYLLYKDDKLGFTVASLVWPPRSGMATHNHRTGWTLYGLYQNEIEVTDFERIDEGTEDDRAHLRIFNRSRIPEGQVIILHEPDFDIHRVINPTLNQSITIHVWGRDVAEVKREVFPRLPQKIAPGGTDELTGIDPLNTVYDNCMEAYEALPEGYLRVKKSFQIM